MFCKRALWLVALLQKFICNSRHSMGLRHPVRCHKHELSFEYHEPLHCFWNVYETRKSPACFAFNSIYRIHTYLHISYIRICVFRTYYEHYMYYVHYETVHCFWNFKLPCMKQERVICFTFYLIHHVHTFLRISYILWTLHVLCTLWDIAFFLK